MAFFGTVAYTKRYQNNKNPQVVAAQKRALGGKGANNEIHAATGSGMCMPAFASLHPFGILRGLKTSAEWTNHDISFHHFDHVTKRMENPPVKKIFRSA